MKRYILLIFVLFIGSSVKAQKYKQVDNTVVTKEWNGTNFSSSKSLIENLENSSNLSFMRRALQKASIQKVQTKEEMITVFVISNEGFSKIQKKNDSIFEASKEPKLKAIITYHMVPGRLDRHSIIKAIQKSNGIAYYATLEGENLGFKEESGQLYLVDKRGNKSLISATDFYHKKGLFHIVQGLVLPASGQ